MVDVVLDDRVRRNVPPVMFRGQFRGMDRVSREALVRLDR